MTRLTQYLMDLGKHPMQRLRKIDGQLFPYKTDGPLGIKDTLSGRSGRQKTAHCSQEMSQMLVCFKKVGFNDERCSKEIEAFQNCNANYLKMKTTEVKADNKPSREVIESMLQRYPQKK